MYVIVEGKTKVEFKLKIIKRRCPLLFEVLFHKFIIFSDTLTDTSGMGGWYQVHQSLCQQPCGEQDTSCYCEGLPNANATCLCSEEYYPEDSKCKSMLGILYIEDAMSKTLAVSACTHQTK